MGLILDTSAVIGWVELQSDSVLTCLRDHLTDDPIDGVPWIHPVTVGELARGVETAPDAGVRERRRAVLEFARRELKVPPVYDGLQTLAFGAVAASVSRKVSHNDCWIAAAAITDRRTLVTQDRRMADQLTASMSESPLAAWLARPDQRLEVIYCPR